MSVDVTTGHAPLSLRALREFSTCGGQALVVAKHAASGGEQADSAAQGEQAERALAALLGEREAQGQQHQAVSLQVQGTGSVAWLAGAISWLSAHGRRAIVRTPRVLPRVVAEAARADGATIILQVASFDVDVQRALLGPQADAAARLLLAAQHLHALQIPVAVAVAPLLPVLHDDTAIEQVCRHIAAADLRDVSLAVGAWSASRQAALERALPSSTTAAIARAFGVFEVDVVGEPDRARTLGPRRLGHREAVTLHARARRIASNVGLRVDECGCGAQCQLAPPPAQPFRSLLAADLFAGVG